MSPDGEYTYKYQVENLYNIDGVAYELDTISGNVTQVISSKYKSHTLIIYEKAPVPGIFTIGLISENEYVFCFPETVEDVENSKN